MKITEEEKDRVLRAISERQKGDTFFVHLYSVGHELGFGERRLIAIYKALEREGKIRVGGKRGYRWCVADVKDKRQQVIDSVGEFGRWEVGLSSLCIITGLKRTQAVDLCLGLYQEGRFRITGLTIERHERDVLDQDEHDDDPDQD